VLLFVQQSVCHTSQKFSRSLSKDPTGASRRVSFALVLLVARWRLGWAVSAAEGRGAALLLVQCQALCSCMVTVCVINCCVWKVGWLFPLRTGWPDQF
jgi:hypothetical protein